MDTTVADTRKGATWAAVLPSKTTGRRGMVRTLEGRAMLRAAMRHWPHVAPETRTFLDTLPWHLRQAVIQHHGEGKALEFVACALGIAERTVQRYLREAHVRYVQRRK